MAVHCEMQVGCSCGRVCDDKNGVEDGSVDPSVAVLLAFPSKLVHIHCVLALPITIPEEAEWYLLSV